LTLKRFSAKASRRYDVKVLKRQNIKELKRLGVYLYFNRQEERECL